MRTGTGIHGSIIRQISLYWGLYGITYALGRLSCRLDNSFKAHIHLSRVEEHVCTEHVARYLYCKHAAHLVSGADQGLSGDPFLTVLTHSRDEQAWNILPLL